MFFMLQQAWLVDILSLENVIMRARLDKTRPVKMKRIRMSAEKEYIVTISKNRPLMTFKDMTIKDMHYTMLIRSINERIVEIDLHKTFESEGDRHDPIIKIRLGIKDGAQKICELAEHDIRNKMSSIIHPLTEEELDRTAYWLAGEDIYYMKESRISDKSMQKSTLRRLQETVDCPAGVGEQNGNKVAIFLKDGKYHKFDFIELLYIMADILNAVVDLTIVINGTEERMSFKEFIVMAKANSPPQMTRLQMLSLNAVSTILPSQDSENPTRDITIKETTRGS